MSCRPDSPDASRAPISISLGVRLVLLAAFFGWYLAAVVNLRLVFEARDGLFLWNPRFFQDFAGQAGWLLRCFDAWWVQLCHQGWPAALVLAALAWLLLASTASFMNATARAEVGEISLVPGILLFALYSGYFAHTAAITGSALALSAANGWRHIPARRPTPSVAGFAGLSIVLYYLAGEAWWCFAACCLVHAATNGKSWRLVLLLAVVGAGARFGVAFGLDRLPLGARSFHPPSADTNLFTWSTALFYACFPLSALCASFYRHAVRTAERLLQRFKTALRCDKPLKLRKAKSTTLAGRTPPRPGATPAVNGLRWAMGTGLGLGLAGAVGCCSLNWDNKALLEIDYCADHQLWNDLLLKARKLRVYSEYTNHDINLALYHTGRLPYEMFTFPQMYNILFSQEQARSDSIAMVRKPCDLMLELGRVNEAEHMALELLEMCPTGHTLKRLALIKLIKNDAASARLFLSVLRDAPIWGRWAQDQLRQLDTRAEVTGDAAVQQARQHMIAQDDLARIYAKAADGGAVDCSAMLLDLLTRDPSNRMAFEYLMAQNLLEGNLQAAVDLLPWADQFFSPALPRHYEEAVLLYAAGHPHELLKNPSGVFFRHRRISDATAAEFDRLRAIMSRAGGSLEKAAPDIAHELAGTYFAYFLTQREHRHA